MPRLSRIVVASAFLLLALPSLAHASYVELDTSEFEYRADAGEANVVDVSRSGTTVTVSDPGASIRLGSVSESCALLNSVTVTCTLPASYGLRVETGDGADVVRIVSDSGARVETGSGADVIQGGSGADDLMSGGSGGDSGGRDVIHGGAGDDEIRGGEAGDTIDGGDGSDRIDGDKGGDVINGGPGQDEISGGDGGDTISSRDDVAESPSCGNGSDVLKADLVDVVATDCEVVQLLAAGTSGESGGDLLDDGGSLEPSDTGGDGGSVTGGSGGTDSGGGEPSNGDGLFAPVSGVLEPDRGVSVGIQPQNGEVLVKAPGGEWVELSAGGRIPVGSEVDAENGRVSITSAVDELGRTQTATFWGGVFKVRQRRNSPVVDIILKGGDFSSCGRRARAGSATAVTAGRRARRRLWSRDRRGRYRTKGRHSVATVRGTRWLTVDRCEGTLTRVTEGAVSVRPRGKGKRKLVRAGDSYLARRR